MTLLEIIRGRRGGAAGRWYGLGACLLPAWGSILSAQVAVPAGAGSYALSMPSFDRQSGEYYAQP